MQRQFWKHGRAHNVSLFDNFETIFLQRTFENKVSKACILTVFETNCNFIEHIENFLKHTFWRYLKRFGTAGTIMIHCLYNFLCSSMLSLQVASTCNTQRPHFHNSRERLTGQPYAPLIKSLHIHDTLSPFRVPPPPLYNHRLYNRKLFQISLCWWCWFRWSWLVCGDSVLWGLGFQVRFITFVLCVLLSIPFTSFDLASCRALLI